MSKILVATAMLADPQHRVGLVNARLATLAALLGVSLLSGCMSLPRATCQDRQFAEYIQTQAEKLPLPGLYEFRAAAAGGHVTIGGRVDSPATLKQLVTVIASTPGLCELSFYGMEFCPADVSDEQIVADARESASRVLGSALAAQLEYYCEDHFLKIYGKLPSLAVREQLEEAVRSVPGVGLYDVACEVVLERPPSDDRVVVGVRRKLRRPFELPNLTFRAHQIEVRSVNNVVYLSGQAPTLLGKLSAASQAAQVDGVRYVVNRIRVPGRPPTQPSPGPSAEAALNSAVTPGDAAERVELVAPSPQTWANPEGQLGATTSDDPPALPETEL